MNQFATIVLALFLAACGGAPLGVDEEALAAQAALGPQSLTHGTLAAATPQLSWSFRGKAGDVIAPDVWPTGGGPFTPRLSLLGPRASNGRRALLASGAPRGHDPSHVAIDGFRLPRTGDYRLVVSLAPGSSGGGRISLRLWMQSSHLPRQEASQVDLALTPSAAARAALQAHADSPHPWTDAEVDAVVADMLRQKDARVALSSAQGLLSALRQQEATDAQRSRATAGAAQIVGTPRHFRALDRGIQAFALWWLGSGQGLLFADGQQGAPRSVADTVAQLVAAWPGAREDTGSRRAQAKVLNGVVYGWQVDWSTEQADLDGTQVWVDFAREWFDSGGHWLAEQSQGASEPDDE